MTVGLTRRNAAASGIAYQLQQAVGAQMVPLPRPQAVSNALLESTIVNLRALVGFLLADAPGPPSAIGYDARPAWFRGGQPWRPATKRRRDALYKLHRAVSQTAAHTVVATAVHPGIWPIREGIALVGIELGSFHAALAPTEQRRFTSGGHTMPSLVQAAVQLGRYYPTPATASRPVRTARTQLRRELGWPP